MRLGFLRFLDEKCKWSLVVYGSSHYLYHLVPVWESDPEMGRSDTCIGLVFLLPRLLNIGFSGR